MTISLTLGNSLLPLIHRRSGHPQISGHLFLGQGQGLAFFPDDLIDFHSSSPFSVTPSYQSAGPGTMAQSAGFGPQNEPQVEKPRRSACAGHEKPPPGVALPGASCWLPTVLWCLFSCGALRAPPSPRRWASPCPSTAGRTRPPGRAPCPARSWWGSPPGGPASGRRSPPENR